MIALHIGCGKRVVSGMVNCDIQKYPDVDIVCDCTKDLPFEKGTVDLIYSCAMIEHMDRSSIDDVLKYWHSLLRVGGEIQLSTDDFQAICGRYLEKKNINELVGLLMGGSKDFTDRHGLMFDFQYLKDKMEKVGFVNIERCDWGEFEPYKLDEDFDDFSRSYLPHMDFENGTLMMLNIRGFKK
ncbi:MAG: methyltransferase domain-containing protein [Nanoarchaeota archaeon]|nr:methyltransferase domain-containing protein [Nanoarchaeota archaeon]